MPNSRKDTEFISPEDMEKLENKIQAEQSENTFNKLAAEEPEVESGDVQAMKPVTQMDMIVDRIRKYFSGQRKN